MEQLTDEQIKLIVETLLFGACLEITDEWSIEDRHEMINIANLIKRDNIILNKIQIHSLALKEENSENLLRRVVEDFPNITKIDTF